MSALKEQPRHRLTLRFVSAPLEAEYQEALVDSRVQNVRIGFVIGLALNTLYTFWDRMVFSAALHDVTLIRELLANAFLGVGFALTFPNRLRRYANLHVVIATLGYTIFFAAINTLEPTPYIFLANVVLLVVYPYLFISGDLILACIGGIVVSTAFLAILAPGRELDRDFALLALNVFGSNFIGMGFAVSLEALRRRQFLATAALAAERTRFRDLLVRVLPTSIADRLQKGEVVADLHMQVAVLFADIVGFTAITAPHPPEVVVGWLDRLFKQFDRIIDAHGLEKIKTIGDAYMAAHGLTTSKADCVRCAMAALDLLKLAAQTQTPDGAPVQIQIGLHVGPVFAGIIGDKRFLYELWGDTVNVASRMEGASMPGEILVTRDVQRQLKHDFEFKTFEIREIKGKGKMETWLLGGLKQ
jgi:adenylate cyclase